MSEPPLSGAPRPVSAATDEQAADPGLRAGVRASRRRSTTVPASPHAEKFRLALAVLAIIGVGAIAMAIIAAQSTRPTTRPWSAFKPQFTGVAGARQIANYISPGYRVSPTQQLAVINVSSNLDGSTLVLKEGPGNNDTALLSGNTLVYQFCGLGPACSIPGKPSPTRLLLVRLEAFELTLYSLHYLKNIQNVVTILPPAIQQAPTTTSGTSSLTTTPPASLGKTAKTILAVELSRDQIKSLLTQPITTLFPNRPPALGGVLGSQAIATMDYITAGQLFTPTSETAPDGSQYLVLNQLAAQ
ncbi:MAG: hypothetical protein QOJ25_356 [Solirubrobacteraceae bacterium]|jgi:hypothetical protein|nr:hypothetical protein [Solirubrobacteraceae bacterium]